MRSRTPDMLTIIKDLTSLHGHATRRDIANWYGYYECAHQKLHKLKKQGLIESAGWRRVRISQSIGHPRDAGWGEEKDADETNHGLKASGHLSPQNP